MSVVGVGRFWLLVLVRTVLGLVGIGRFALSFRLLFCLVGIGGLAFVFRPFLRLDVVQELAQINVDRDRLPVSAQVDGFGEETTVDDTARPPINRVVRDLDAFPTLSGETVMDGDCAPVLRAAEHVADQVRLRGDLFVEIMGCERGQFVSCCKDRPRDARGP